MKFEFDQPKQVVYFNEDAISYRSGIAYDEFVIDAKTGGVYIIEDIYEAAAVFAQVKKYDFNFQPIMVFDEWVAFDHAIAGPEDYLELLESNYTPSQMDILFGEI